MGAVHVFESRWPWRAVPRTPLPCHWTAEGDASDSVGADSFVDGRQSFKRGGGHIATVQSVFDDQSAPVGDRVIRPLLFPAVVHEPSPDEILTDNYERRAPDDSKPAKRPVGWVGPDIPNPGRA